MPHPPPRRNAAPPTVTVPGAGSRVGTASRFSFADGAERVRWFREYLAKLGIEPLPGSPLSRGFEAAARVGARTAPALEGADPPQDLRDLFADFVGMAELAAAIQHVRAQPQARQLKDHLRLMVTEKPRVPAPEVTQTRRADAPAAGATVDPSADKLFELIVACYAMRVGSDVEIDPVRATAAQQGKNPDVLATIDRRRWGFACKSLHSPAPAAMYEHLVKGINQIEQSDAEVGAVLFSLRTQLDPNSLWPAICLAGPEQPGAADMAGVPDKYGVWLSDEDFTNALRRLPSERNQALLDYLRTAQETEIGVSVPPNEVRPAAILAVENGMERLFEGKKASPGWAFYLHGVAGVLRSDGPDAGRPSVTSTRLFVFTPAVPLTEPDAKRVTSGLSHLNDAAQRVFDPIG